MVRQESLKIEPRFEEAKARTRMADAWQKLRRSFAAIAPLVALVLALGAAVPVPANAVDMEQSTTFLSPFPDNDIYQVTVFGDGFAEGLLGGLVQAFGSDVRLNIQRQITPIATCVPWKPVRIKKVSPNILVDIVI